MLPTNRKFFFFAICLTLLFSANILAQQTDINGPAGSDSFGERVFALPNGNIVVTDPDYDIPAGAVNVGAVYLYNSTGTLISTLIGSTANDQIGSSGVEVLTNGNYVIRSPNWDNGGTANVGAATWGNSATGVSGTVSAANSLIGASANDQVSGFGVLALTNGNYVVRISGWDGPSSQVGAITWGDGTTGISGVVSAANSLVGSQNGDFIGGGGVFALNNGNYVVISVNWDGGSTDLGAVTWGNGTTGTIGTVSAANSLVGSVANDRVGSGGVTRLTNGNYVVRSHQWDNGGTANVGASTWGNGTTGTSGTISVANSLIGSTASDQVSSGEVTALSNGNYVVSNPDWDNGGTADSGAITYSAGNPVSLAQTIPKIRKYKLEPKTYNTNSFAISMNNSVLGTAANGGNDMNFSYNSANNQLVVGRPADNIVTLVALPPTSANVTVSGKVQTAKGRAIPRAVVSITDSDGQIRTARTNMFGYFSFENVEAGETYTFNTRAKGYRFATQILNVGEDIKDFNITAQ